MRQTTLHPLVVLHLPKQDKRLLVTAKAILGALTGNASLPTPNPTAAALNTLLAAFDKAITDVQAKVPGATKARGEARIALRMGLEHLRDYVQSVVDADVDHASTIAEGAKMSLRKVPVRHKAPLAAQQGDVSGLALLIAKAVAGALAYYWQYSIDQKTWTSVAETGKATSQIAGLTPGQTYAFRFRVLTRKGTTDWSQVVSLLIK